MAWSFSFLSIFLLVLALTIAGLLVARKVYREMKEKKEREEEHDNVSNNIPISPESRPAMKVLLFYATWCGACKKIKNQWNAFHETYMNPNAHINQFRVQPQKVDCSNFQTNQYIQSLLTQYEVKHFPSVVILIPEDLQNTMDNTSFVNFSGKITKKTLESFVSQVVDKMRTNRGETKRLTPVPSNAPKPNLV